MTSEKLEKRLLTVKEAADYLRVNQTTIYRLLRRSEIPAFKVGGDWRFNLESIDNWRLSADRESYGRAVEASRQPGSPTLSLSLADRPDTTVMLVRIYEAINQMLEPVADISRLLPTLKRIAEALEDKRDTSSEIARLYEGQEIAFRSHTENLVKFVPAPFGVADADRRLVSFNDAYCQLFGFRRKELRNMRLMDLVHHDDLDRFMALNSRLWRSKIKSGRFVGRRLIASGEAIPTRSTAWPISRKPNAGPDYMAAVLQRVATKREASAAFTRCADDLSKRRERFMSRVRGAS